MALKSKHNSQRAIFFAIVVLAFVSALLVLNPTQAARRCPIPDLQIKQKLSVGKEPVSVVINDFDLHGNKDPIRKDSSQRRPW